MPASDAAEIIRQRSSVRDVLRSAQTSLAEETTFRETEGGDIYDVSDETHLHHVRNEHHKQVRKAPRNSSVRLGHALESHTAHLVIILLVMLDLTAVFGEVMLTSVCGVARHGGSSDHSERRRLLSLQHTTTGTDMTAVAVSMELEEGRWSAGQQHRVLAELTPEEEAREARIEGWEHGLHWFSISILCALLLYQAALLYCFGWRYFTKLWYMLDVLVLVISLVLELTLPSDEVGFLTLLLVWRVIRIVHGFLLTEQEADHESHYYRQKIAVMKANCTCGAANTVPKRKTMHLSLGQGQVAAQEGVNAADIETTPLAASVQSPGAGVGSSAAAAGAGSVAGLQGIPRVGAGGGVHTPHSRAVTFSVDEGGPEDENASPMPSAHA